MKHPRVITTGDDNVWTFQIPTYKVTDNGIEDGDGAVAGMP